MRSLVNNTSVPAKSKFQKLIRGRKTTAPEQRKTLYGWFIDVWPTENPFTPFIV